MSTSRLTTAFVAAGSAVVAAVGVATFAAANNTTTTAEVCVGPDGQVRVADECRPSEERLIIQGEQGPQGDKGDQGDPGPKGDQGEPGTPGGVKNVIIRSDQVRVEPDDFRSVSVFCPEGNTAVGGGFDLGAFNTELQVLQSERVSSFPSSWAVRVFNSDEERAGFFTASVYCVEQG